MIKIKQIKDTWNNISKSDKVFISCLLLFGVGQIVIGILMIVRA